MKTLNFKKRKATILALFMTSIVFSSFGQNTFVAKGFLKQDKKCYYCTYKDKKDPCDYPMEHYHSADTANIDIGEWSAFGTTYFGVNRETMAAKLKKAPMPDVNTYRYCSPAANKPPFFYGIIDINSNIIVPPIFTGIEHLKGVVALAYMDSILIKDKKIDENNLKRIFYVLNMKSGVYSRLSDDYDYEVFSPDFILAKNRMDVTGGFGLINVDGLFILPAKYLDIRDLKVGDFSAFARKGNPADSTRITTNLPYLENYWPVRRLKEASNDKGEPKYMRESINRWRYPYKYGDRYFLSIKDSTGYRLLNEKGEIFNEIPYDKIENLGYSNYWYNAIGNDKTKTVAIYNEYLNPYSSVIYAPDEKEVIKKMEIKFGYREDIPTPEELAQIKREERAIADRMYYRELEKKQEEAKQDKYEALRREAHDLSGILPQGEGYIAFPRPEKYSGVVTIKNLYVADYPRSVRIGSGPEIDCGCRPEVFLADPEYKDVELRIKELVRVRLPYGTYKLSIYAGSDSYSSQSTWATSTINKETTVTKTMEVTVTIDADHRCVVVRF